MEFPELILSIAVIAVGVAAIAYILLRKPKAPASIGSEGEISLGEVSEEETDAVETVEETEENTNA